jgi:hypothetical protein
LDYEEGAMSDHGTETKTAVREILLGLTAEEQHILSKVVELEYQNKHLRKPHVNADIRRIVEEAIR